MTSATCACDDSCPLFAGHPPLSVGIATSALASSSGPLASSSGLLDAESLSNVGGVAFETWLCLRRKRDGAGESDVWVMTSSTLTPRANECDELASAEYVRTPFGAMWWMKAVAASRSMPEAMSAASRPSTVIANRSDDLPHRGIEPSIDQSASQPINQSIRSIRRLRSLINQSIYQIHQSINQPVNQSINPSDPSDDFAH